VIAPGAAEIAHRATGWLGHPSSDLGYRQRIVPDLHSVA
jgi:hypothetical protein